MSRAVRYLGIGIIVLAVVSLIIGVVFVQQGFAKKAWLVSAMEQEKITFNIEVPVRKGNIICPRISVKFLVQHTCSVIIMKK